MIDLQINNAGDLIAGTQNSLATLKLTWKISKYPAAKFVFKTGRNAKDMAAKESIYNNPAMLLRFDTQIRTNSTTISTCFDDDENLQRIKILVRSSARIIKKKHEDITSASVINEIQSAVYDLVENLLDNPSVTVEKATIDGTPFSWQNLNIYIYDGSKEIYEFQLEG